MNEEFERLQNIVRAAKQAYDVAEREFAAARYTLNYHERAAKAEWDKMNSAALSRS